MRLEDVIIRGRTVRLRFGRQERRYSENDKVVRIPRPETDAERLAVETKDIEHLRPFPPRVTMRWIRMAFAMMYQVSVQDMISSDRGHGMADVRQHCMYEMRRILGQGTTYVAIAEIMGRGDHTTVYHAINVWPEKAKKKGIRCLPIPFKYFRRDSSVRQLQPGSVPGHSQSPSP